MVQAHDEATRASDEKKMVPQVRADLLKRLNPEQNAGIPGFLPLYVGMRLTLLSKDCVRFGLMKGCTCVVQQVVLADGESLPEKTVAGHVHQLTYMPVGLLLKAEDAQWTLPSSELPEDLPQDQDKTGLFLLRPTYDYIRT